MKLINSIIFVLLATLFLVGCEPEVLDEVPENYTLKYKQVVYVQNDGRCETGEVIKITGGSRKKNVRRKYECVPSPLSD